MNIFLYFNMTNSILNFVQLFYIHPVYITVKCRHLRSEIFALHKHLSAVLLSLYIQCKIYVMCRYFFPVHNIWIVHNLESLHNITFPVSSWHYFHALQVWRQHCCYQLQIAFWSLQGHDSSSQGHYTSNAGGHLWWYKKRKSLCIRALEHAFIKGMEKWFRKCVNQTCW
jgi:hypothetical protein